MNGPLQDKLLDITKRHIRTQSIGHIFYLLVWKITWDLSGLFAYFAPSIICYRSCNTLGKTYTVYCNVSIFSRLRAFILLVRQLIRTPLRLRTYTAN